MASKLAIIISISTTKGGPKNRQRASEPPVNIKKSGQHVEIIPVTSAWELS